MTHDPLCPAQDCDHSEHCSCFIDFGICLCQCSTLIAKVEQIMSVVDGTSGVGHSIIWSEAMGEDTASPLTSPTDSL